MTIKRSTLSCLFLIGPLTTADWDQPTSYSRPSHLAITNWPLWKSHLYSCLFSCIQHILFATNLLRP